MKDWNELSLSDRHDIETDMLWALDHVGLTDVVVWWIMPRNLLPWHLKIRSGWCKDREAHTIGVKLQAVMALAGIFAPKGSITLCGVAPVHA